MVDEQGIEPRIERLLASLEKIKQQLEDIALDEMSEARAYSNMARVCYEDNARWNLFLIAMDSIVHQEIAWALIRAINEIQVMAKELLSHRPRREDMGQVVDLVEIHKSIEDLAKSSYEGLLHLAEPGTTLRKLLELLVEEEKKHEQLAVATVKRLRSVLQEREGGES
ncbi:hypothetical protein [Pyrodictium abyssi]|uniref:Rubrerythrin diiron-binding domain-containing protein n=1 Tax=Pyrodictium abyssi TaxID=54256 RepID=A0ABM8IZQ8_9CREN|nr:hypothetical protein PABY_18580 [Pyrodictium abyssi]